MRLVFFGSPGSGKGTQANSIASSFHLTHISTGELFRGKVLEDTRIGRRIAEVIASGQLVDDITTNYVLFKAIQGLSRFIVDGYPRNVCQARSFDVHLENIGLELTCALFLAVPEEEAVRRLAQRRNERQEKTENYRRADDTPEVIRHRFEVYRKATAPLIEYYGERMVSVDGTGSTDDVTARILKALKKWE
jgi:adenylate kinase